MKLNLRQAKPQDMDFFVRMAASEGWNPGWCDGDIFYSADPEGFFVAEADGKPIACISSVSYGGEAFIGLFIVDKAFRGKMIGPRLGKMALDRVKGQNIGMDGVLKKVPAYEKFGFLPFHRNIRYQFLMSGAPEAFGEEGAPDAEAEPGQNCIKPAGDVPFKAIAEFDRKHFPAPREAFLKAWLSATTHRALVWEQNGSIQGLGVLRACRDGFKIGPLFATRFEVADLLFRALVRNIQEAPVFLDTIEQNEIAQALVQKYQMTLVFETMRMYSKNQPDALWQEVVGITTFELG